MGLSDVIHVYILAVLERNFLKTWTEIEHPTPSLQILLVELSRLEENNNIQNPVTLIPGFFSTAS